jgi:hypothetical protein
MKIVFLVVAICIFSNTAMAGCDFKDLIHNTDGTVTYSKADHICVGQLVQSESTKDQQITDYKKALDLKDLAITKSDARAQLWMDTSVRLESTVQSVDKLKKDNEWLYFSLGALTVIGTGFMAAQLLRAH